MNKDRALPAEPDRAVVNGAASVSALRASVPSALRSAAPSDGRQHHVGMWLTEAHAEVLTLFAHSCGLYRAQFMRECINAGRGKVLETYLGVNGAREIGKRATAITQAIEARRAETGTGSVHESAVPEGNAPEGDQSS